MDDEEAEKRTPLEMLEDYCIPLDEFKRLIAFLLLFQEDGRYLPHPGYIVEKYMRYVRDPHTSDEYLWGLHPLLRRRFDAYCEKYDLGADKDVE